MSTNHHTAIATGAAANASVFNAPLGTLDSAITANTTSITANTTSIAGLTTTVQTVLDSIILGGAAVTLTNGAANAAQKVVTVDSSAQFVAGCYVEYTLVGGVVERNVVDTVDSSTQITLITNIGTGGIADNSPVAVIPVGFYHASEGKYHVADYGAVGDGSTDDTAAFQAAIAAVKARTVSSSKKAIIYLAPGKHYKITDSLDLTNIFDVVIDGGTLNTKITYADADATAANRVLFDCLGSGWLTFKNFQVSGDTTDIPAVCISLGRSDTSENAGTNVIERVYITGYWSLAAIYNVSAELTTYRNIWVEVYGPDTATTKYGVYVSGVNDLSVGSHVTRSATSSAASQWFTNFFIGTADLTNSLFVPIYLHATGAVAIRDGYVFTYDSQPAVKFCGSVDGVVIDNLLVEGNPDKSIYFSAYSGAGTVNAVSIINSALGAYANYGIYSDAGVSVLRLNVRNCGGYKTATTTSAIKFAGPVENADIDTWWSYSEGTFEAADFLLSRLHVRQHTVTITSPSGSTIFSDATGADHYYHLNTGLRVGTVGATNLAEINDIRTASDTWNPGELVDGASEAKSVTVNGVTAAGEWFCMAHLTTMTDGAWQLSAFALDGYVKVVLTNHTGGTLNLSSGTVYVTAWKITAA